jgi:regulator of cell morphogenesis and NO signaling
MNTQQTTLAELAATRPAAARIFFKHGLDFCCRGRRPLAEACKDKGLDPEAILREVERAEPSADDVAAWSEKPLAALVGHILARYHDRLREDLPILVAMAAKVEMRHAEKATTPFGLADHLRAMQAAAFDHLEKEERVVFPHVLSGNGASLAAAIQCLEQEHTDHGTNLAHTRELTGNLVPPPEACATWRALYSGLESLERDLMEHIHLENNVLFPRVLCA